jgi:succinylglutamic semialdehyde dehydrogenase
LPVEDRIKVITSFSEHISSNAEDLAHLIAQENGKPLWDAKTEVNGLIVKVQASIAAFEERASEHRREVRGMMSVTKFKSHGVMAVLGPFNFPMSMPNSHILPALLSGNVIVFKPSELTPLCGLALGKIWQDAGLPPGVLNCLTGGKEVGQALISSPLTNGVLFIGSRNAGLAIRQALWDHPEKITALEMGGNSPLVIWDYDDVSSAVLCTIQSSIVSAGQRCTAARRVIIRENDGIFLKALEERLLMVIAGHHTASPEPYYGPLIRKSAAERVLEEFRELENLGGRVLIQPRIEGPNKSIVTPGLIDMTQSEYTR